VAENFSDAATRELAFLVDEHGFRLVEASNEVVRWESPAAVGTASYYPPECQVDVTVAPVERRDLYDELVLSGMVGRASPERLLHLAAEKLRSDHAALRGDSPYYERLGDERRREAEAWTAFYAGKGPQPRGKLP
jgi:hypothetical protein